RRSFWPSHGPLARCPRLSWRRDLLKPQLCCATNPQREIFHPAFPAQVLGREIFVSGKWRVPVSKLSRPLSRSVADRQSTRPVHQTDERSDWAQWCIAASARSMPPIAYRSPKDGGALRRDSPIILNDEARTTNAQMPAAQAKVISSTETAEWWQQT